MTGESQHHEEAVPERCLTCADEAREVRVLRLLGDGLASVDVDGRDEVVSVALVEPQVGDCVLVHAGEAIAKVAE